MRKASVFCYGIILTAATLTSGCARNPATPAEALAQKINPQPTGFVASIKSGAAKAGEIIKPSAKAKPHLPPSKDAIVKNQPPGTAGAELHVSMAQLQEKAGNTAGAVTQYEKALKMQPDYLPALMGYAHLQDREGKLTEAAELYEKATLKHPGEAGAFNDLGLCYARQKKFDKSLAALNKAVELSPQRPLYRNNIATVLVELRRYDDAVKHLAVAHGEAAANYNMGYLLQQKGERDAAKSYFATSLQRDPKLTAARDWLARLEGSSTVAVSDIAQSQAQPVPQPSAVVNAGMNVQYMPGREPQAAPGGRPPEFSRAQPAGAPSYTEPNFSLRYPERAGESSGRFGALAPLPEDVGSEAAKQEGPALRLLPAVQPSSYYAQ